MFGLSHNCYLYCTMKVSRLIILCLSIGSFAASSSQECENDTDDANSCGQGQFWNEAEQRCETCPFQTFQDSKNHKCSECKPCTHCEEGFVSKDYRGCPPDQDTSCVRIVGPSVCFMCNGGRVCMLRHRICDGHFDCSDGSDEEPASICNITETGCPADFFMCGCDRSCIPKDWTCNGIFECADGSDEDTNGVCYNPLKVVANHIAEMIMWPYKLITQELMKVQEDGDSPYKIVSFILKIEICLVLIMMMFQLAVCVVNLIEKTNNQQTFGDNERGQDLTDMKAVILIIFCLSARPFVASGSQPECENGPDGANSCGRGQFWNETVQACLVCPVNQYQDSINHRCPICKPCTPCKEGFVSADEGGCLPHQDTSCIKISDIDQVTDSISSTTEEAAGFGHLTESSSTQLNQETQPLGQPEVTKISPIEYSDDGGQYLIVTGKNLRQDCKVTIVKLPGDGISGWNGTCAVEAVFKNHTHVLCKMPAYQTESLKDLVSVYAVLTCRGDYSSEHPLTYIPVEASANDQKNEDSQTVIIILIVICSIFFMAIIVMVMVIILMAVHIFRQKKKGNYHLTPDSAGGNERGQDSTDVQSGSRAGQNGTVFREHNGRESNDVEAQNGNETELSDMLPESGHVQRG